MQGMDSRSDCPLCGSKEMTVFIGGDPPPRDGKELRATTDRFGDFADIYRCLDCSFVFQAMPACLIAQKHASVVDKLYLEEEQGRKRTARRILDTIERFASPGHLLDVGCFTGLLLDEARSRGWDTYGVEPSRWAAGIARERYGLDVRESTVEDLDVEVGSETFDLVTLIDVVEHLSNPRTALMKASRLLRPGGHIYVSTPDVLSGPARLLGRRWWGYRLEHLSYFSKRTLGQALEQAGLQIVQVCRHGRDFTLGYWASKLVKAEWVPGELITQLLEHSGLGNRLVHLDLRDQVDILARKVGTSRAVSTPDA